MKDKVAVIIPTFNRKQYLRNVLTQLFHQIDAVSELIVIVVVDGSTDGTIEMLEKDFPEVILVKGTGNWWYTKSMNEGFKKAEEYRPGLVLTLNDDIVLDPSYLQLLLNAKKQVEENAIMGSLSLTADQPYRIFFSGIRKYIRWRQKNIRYHPRFTLVPLEELTGIHPSIVLPGRGMLIPYPVLKKLNYFDEYYIQYHSDEDFCLRAWKNGFPVYISWDARVYSHVKDTGKGMSFIKTGFLAYLKGFTNKYSRIYIPQKARFYYTHCPKILWPVTMLTFFISNLKTYFKSSKYED